MELVPFKPVLWFCCVPHLKTQFFIVMEHNLDFVKRAPSDNLNWYCPICKWWNKHPEYAHCNGPTYYAYTCLDYRNEENRGCIPLVMEFENENS